ncbi:MAG: MarR family transcriptional regulator [Thermoleophilaceae bacterium]
MARAVEGPRTRAAAEAEPAVEAWRLIHDLIASQRRRVTALGSELGLAPGQLWALWKLDPDRPKSMRALAGELGCDNSNVTGIIDRLEHRGLVVRRACASDRRVKLVHVTEAGLLMRQRLSAGVDRPPPGLAALPAQDRRTLRDLLRRALDTSPDQGSPKG